METKYLIINSGSASKKYALYSGKKALLFAHFEVEHSGYVATLRQKEIRDKRTLTEKEYIQGVQTFINLCIENNTIKHIGEIQSLGFRIVAPGTFFQESKIIDDVYLKKLADIKEIAPLHIRAVVDEINVAQGILPDATKVGISDSKFHRTLPLRSRLYGISQQIAKDFDIYRFGYHGIAIQSALRRLKEILGHTPSNLIICHLGGGASVTALKQGHSIDTSMGLTPAEGLLMNTRVGDIDPLAVSYISHKMNFPLEKIVEFMNNQAGMLGLSGRSGDIRELLEYEKNGDENAALALEMFVYRVKKYIGAYSAALGGLDVLVLTGAISERSIVIRERICGGLEYLGISLDQRKNKETVDTDGFIESKNSSIKIAVIKINEMEEIALRILKYKK